MRLNRNLSNDEKHTRLRPIEVKCFGIFFSLRFGFTGMEFKIVSTKIISISSNAAKRYFAFVWYLCLFDYSSLPPLYCQCHHASKRKRYEKKKIGKLMTVQRHRAQALEYTFAFRFSFILCWSSAKKNVFFLVSFSVGFFFFEFFFSGKTNLDFNWAYLVLSVLEMNCADCGLWIVALLLHINYLFRCWAVWSVFCALLLFMIDLTLCVCGEVFSVTYICCAGEVIWWCVSFLILLSFFSGVWLSSLVFSSYFQIWWNLKCFAFCFSFE